MFGPIGMPELILIFVVALLVFGPKKLPEIGKSLGKGLAEFKKASEELKRTIEAEIESSKQDASTVRQSVTEAAHLIAPPEVVPRSEPTGASPEPAAAPQPEASPAPHPSTPA
jgi:sec-independent protein translocase protein TatA